MFRFANPLWRHTGDAAWYFVTLPHDVADAIEESTATSRTSFGSVPVEATIGTTTWRTSVFPDRREASYLLPVKRAVRTAEGIDAGDLVAVSLLIAKHP